MDEDIPKILIPNELCRRTGIAGKLFSSDKISVFGYEHLRSLCQDKCSSYAPCQPSILHLQKDIVLFEPVLRKLVNESNGTFLTVQQIVASEENAKNSLLLISKQYRSIIRACLENLQDEAYKAKEEYKQVLFNYIAMFYSIECIWHLCEMLYIEAVPGNIILPNFLEWIRFHYPKYERNAVKIMTEKFLPGEEQPQYWDTLIGNLLQGRIDVVRALLKMHSLFDSDPFQAADEIFKTLPIFSVYGGLSATEFSVRRKHWVVDVLSKLDANLFEKDRNLNLVMKLIVGVEDAWEEVCPKFETWYEHLAAWLFYTEPTVKSFELGPYVKKCIKKKNKDKLKHLDFVLLALLQGDLMQVLVEIQNMSENGWFVTHLLDVLYHCGAVDCLDLRDIRCASQFRESFILEYGSMLMAHSSLWQVGLSYLDHCPSQGLGRIEVLLSLIPLNTQGRTLKILKEAQKRKLFNLVNSIYKIQSIKLYHEGRLGDALAWAMKRQDTSLVTFLSDKFLREYCENGEIRNIDLLDSLGSQMLVSDRLAFLAKYCEFHKLYQACEFRAAAVLIVSLLDSKITPSYFWSSLLLDTLPLLEKEEIVFSSNETYTILNCLEEKSSLSDLEDKMNILRLAAARNLAKAVVYEAETVIT